MIGELLHNMIDTLYVDTLGDVGDRSLFPLDRGEWGEGQGGMNVHVCLARVQLCVMNVCYII